MRRPLGDRAHRLAHPRAIDRAIAGADAMHTADGEPAAPRLARLRDAIVAERVAALARGRVDPAWVRDTVRDVAAWTPESELTLLAALGGIARVKPA